MAKYANQKNITIKKKEICDKQHIYAAINKAAMLSAMRELKPNSFKLWAYFASNQEGFSFDLSQKAVEADTGIKKDTYDAAIKELIDKKYLVLVDKKTIFNFYEVPEDQKQEKPTFEESKEEENKKWEKPTFESGKNPFLKMGFSHEKYYNNTTQNNNNGINTSLRSVLIPTDSSCEESVTEYPTIRRIEVFNAEFNGRRVEYLENKLVYFYDSKKTFRIVD